MRAVEAREEVLRALTSFRQQHDDCELKVNRAPARARLLELLLALRQASAEVVEAVCAWRRSVAPLPGHGPSASGAEAGGQSAVKSDQASSPSVASPNARGACWPFGKDKKDYLWHVAHDDSVVRSFDDVLELAPTCDPLLLLTSMVPSGGGGATAAQGKLRMPPLETSRRERFENLRMLLLEEELTLELLSNKSVPTKSYAALHRGYYRACTMPASPSSAVSPEPSKESCRASSNKEPSRRSRPGSMRKSGPFAVNHAKVPLDPRKSVISCTDEPNELQRALKAKMKKRFLASIMVPHQFGFSAMGFAHEQDSKEALSRLANQMGEQARAHQVEGSPRQAEGKPQYYRQGSAGQKSAFERRRSSGSSHRGSQDFSGRSSFGYGSRANGHRKTLTGKKSSVLAARKASDLPAVDQGMPAIDRMRIDAAFARFAHDGQLHQDELRDALRRAGFVHPVEAWAEEAYKGVTSFTTICLDEFHNVVLAYEAKQRMDCLEHFRSGSSPESLRNGLRSSLQIAEILRKMDLYPMPHVLAEAIMEVDEDVDGQVTFSDFYRLVVMLREREGFTPYEHEELMNIFRKFDYSGCSEMATRDLHHALLYLGLRASVDEVERFMEEVDVDQNGTLDQSEFMFCMRRVRDCEVEHVRRLVEATDRDKNGSISADEMQNLLEGLGYFMPDEHIIAEVFEEVGDRMEIAENNELDVGGVWQFLRIYHMREGLSRQEAAEVDEAFERFSSQHAGNASEVSKRDLPKVLHSLGYRTSFEQQLLLASEVDTDRSGALCLGELRKLVRMCREVRLRMIKSTFDKFDLLGVGALPASKARIALGNICGCIFEDLLESEKQEKEEIRKHFDQGTPVPLRIFMRTALWAEEAARHVFRESEGYSADEVAMLRQHFQDFEASSTGTVNCTDLVGLVTAASPGISEEPKLRPLLMDIIREASQQKAETGNSCITFPEFLQLMFTVRDMVHREKLAKERQAMERSGFSPGEVHQFRSIFHDWASENQRMTRQAFQEMLAPLCPRGGQSASILATLWRRLFIDDDGLGHEEPAYTAEEIDFSRFLELMRAVLDANLGNVSSLSDDGQPPLERSKTFNLPSGLAPPDQDSFGVPRRNSLLLAGTGRRQPVFGTRPVGVVGPTS